jgi:hypothetical protein
MLDRGTEEKIARLRRERYRARAALEPRLSAFTLITQNID